MERFAGLLDAAIIFSDILVIPQAMGMVVEMVDKKGPHFPDPLRSPDDKQYAEVLQRQVDVTKELDYVYKAITLTRKKLQGRVPLLGFCGAPWTLLCYMVEGGGTKMFKESKTWIYKYPEQSKLLLQKIAELCVDHLAHQVEAGAQVCLQKLWMTCEHLTRLTGGIDGASLRLVGRGALPSYIQGVLRAILGVHSGEPAQEAEVPGPGASSHDRLPQGGLVFPGRNV